MVRWLKEWITLILTPGFMTPFGWFLVGILFLAFCGLVVLSIVDRGKEELTCRMVIRNVFVSFLNFGCMMIVVGLCFWLYLLLKPCLSRLWNAL